MYYIDTGRVYCGPPQNNIYLNTPLEFPVIYVCICVCVNVFRKNQSTSKYTSVDDKMPPVQ